MYYDTSLLYSPGWGDHYNWMGLHEGWAQARKEGKPIMCVMTREGCPACIHLRKSVREDPQMEEAAKDFVLVNLEWNEIPDTPEFGPDGKYFPRYIVTSHVMSL